MVKVKYDDGIYAFEPETFDLKTPQEMYDELCKSGEWEELHKEPLLKSLKSILSLDDSSCKTSSE